MSINSKRRFFLRYISIIQKLRNSDASFDEISNHLKRQSKDTGEDLIVSQRTFQRDLNDIRDIFNIDIKTNATGQYYISDDGDVVRQSRMLETFDHLDLLYKAKNPSNYIFYENRGTSGSQNIHGVLHAIHNRLALSFRHEKYWEDSLTYRTVEPLAVKESQHRWYLIAKDRKDKKIKTFGMDRISDLKFEKVKFEYPKNFDHDKMFGDSFGVITTGNIEEVILAFDSDQKKYLGSLMIHSTQTELADDENEYRIKLRMKVTYDLIKEILSYGDAVEVIAPKTLRIDMKKRLKDALGFYS
mgnify:CR=1 FL=1